MKLSFFLLILLIFNALACAVPQQATPTPANPFNQPVTVLPPGVTPPAADAPPPTLPPSPTPVPAARIAAGDQAIFNGDWQAALDAYQAALTTSAETEIRAAALLGMGRMQWLQGQPEIALETLSSLRATFPDTPQAADACFYLAEVYRTLARYTDADQAYDCYLQTRGNLLAAYIYEQQGNMRMLADDPAAAISAYQQALAAPRAGLRTTEKLSLAAAYTANGQYSDALTLYDQIFNETDNDYTKAQVLFLSANIYRALGNQEQAFARYQQAVQDYPRAYDAYSALVELVNAGAPVDEVQRGLVDYYAGQEGVALAAFERYLQAPGDLLRKATARYYQGLILQQRGLYTEAIQAWQWILQNTPESDFLADAWDEIAFTQWAYLDDYPAALATYLDFTQTYPQHERAPEFYDRAARVAERAGDYPQAATLWGDLATRYPSSPQGERARLLSGVSSYRSGQFPQAQAAFFQLANNATSPQMRAAALLWLGKVQHAVGDENGARTYWEQAAQSDPTGYYSERAQDLLNNRSPFAPPLAYDLSFDYQAERTQAETWLHQTFALPATTDLHSLGALADDARWQRGLQLWRLGLYEQARFELEDLREAVQNNPADSYRLGNALIELGLYRSGIYAIRQVLTLAGMDDAATMQAPRYFNRLRFGTYYADLVIPAAQENGFHPLFVFSLTRQESLFEGFVRSSAGARGLMQIIPSTGSYIAELLGWPPDYTADDLYRPLVNVRFGSAYLARQRDAFDGDLYAALAAYNAGPGNAAVWHDLSGGDPDLFLELIRYPETQNYIRGIYEMYAIYYRLYDRSP
ncbi:MAG: transglycosylase SLT domain-containing protein [Anaerolineales bacterium]